jgi:hypothetical protein
MHEENYWVVREDGNPGGYRWGQQRKQQLLAQESREKGNARISRTRLATLI